MSTNQTRQKLTTEFGDALARLLEHGFSNLPPPAQAIVAEAMTKHLDRIRITVSLEPYGVVCWLIGDNDTMTKLFAIAGKQPNITLN